MLLDQSMPWVESAAVLALLQVTVTGHQYAARIPSALLAS